MVTDSLIILIAQDCLSIISVKVYMDSPDIYLQPLP